MTVDLFSESLIQFIISSSNHAYQLYQLLLFS
jgi:hypothetical protein